MASSTLSKVNMDHTLSVAHLHKRILRPYITTV